MSVDSNLYVGSYLHVDTERDLYTLMWTNFKDGDLFITVKLNGKKGVFLLSNLKDPSTQGALNIKDEGVYDLPSKDFSHENWKKVEKMLKEESIKFEEKTGIILWFS
jgi:hypothetical protein